MQGKSAVTQGLGELFGQDTGQGQRGRTSRVGPQLGVQSRRHGVDVKLKSQIDRKGGHQDACGDVAGSDGGNESGEEEHQDRDEIGSFSYQRDDFFGEQVQSSVGGSHSEEESDADKGDEHGAGKSFGDVTCFQKTHCAVGLDLYACSDRKLCQKECSADGEETDIHFFDKSDGDDYHQYQQRDLRHHLSDHFHS